MELRETLTELEAHKRRRPGPMELVPAHHVDRYNAAVLDLADDLTESWATVYRIRDDHVLPASERDGRPIDTYDRKLLIAKIRAALRRVSVEPSASRH